jgi:hypothetical protein
MERLRLFERVISQFMISQIERSRFRGSVRDGEFLEGDAEKAYDAPKVRGDSGSLPAGG